MKTILLTILMTILSIEGHTQEYFHVQKTQLIDAKGQPFIIAGVNNPHAWLGEKSYHALDEIAASGANTLRIVWNTRGKTAELERVIERCIALKMIPMVELHDVTGNSSGERLGN